MKIKLNRECLNDFKEWLKRGDKRKPLLIRGARQTGKSTAVRMFAEQCGLQLIELNMEKKWGFATLFQNNDPRKVIEATESRLQPRKMTAFLSPFCWMSDCFSPNCI